MDKEHLLLFTIFKGQAWYKICSFFNFSGFLNNHNKIIELSHTENISSETQADQMFIGTVPSPEHIRKLHFPASLVLRLRLCDWVLVKEISVEENKTLQALTLKYFPLSPYPNIFSSWHLVECRGPGEEIQRPLSEVAEAHGGRKELGFLSNLVVESCSRWLPGSYLTFVLSGYTLGLFVPTTGINFFDKDITKISPFL